MDAKSKAERDAEVYMQECGPYQSVDRFFRKYSKWATKKAYAHALAFYFRWLRTDYYRDGKLARKAVQMTPDEMVVDNLRCIFESSAVDVARKRRHTELLDEYINVHMVNEGKSESLRVIDACAIQQFYEKNDSKLWGDFAMAAAQQPREPAPPLSSEDISAVLKALPLWVRVPLIMVRQGGIEINRVLGLRWKDVGDVDKTYPLKLEFFGRKKHKRGYHSYAGRDAIEHLKVWRRLWKEREGRDTQPGDLVFVGKHRDGRATLIGAGFLNEKLKETAALLFEQGLIKNGDPRSWHTHALRHSFETEASHAGVRAEVRDFFEGHLRGIQWVYNHRDELHEGDLIAEWLKIEPYVSLEMDATRLKQKFDEDVATALKSRDLRIEQLEKDSAFYRQALEDIAAGKVKVVPPAMGSKNQNF